MSHVVHFAVYRSDGTKATRNLRSLSGALAAARKLNHERASALGACEPLTHVIRQLCDGKYQGKWWGTDNQ